MARRTAASILMGGAGSSPCAGGSHFGGERARLGVLGGTGPQMSNGEERVLLAGR